MAISIRGLTRHLQSDIRTVLAHIKALGINIDRSEDYETGIVQPRYRKLSDNEAAAVMRRHFLIRGARRLREKLP